MEFLIEQDADIEATDKDGFTPLLNAACEDHAENILCLLKQGANVASLDKQDRTAIYLASEFNNLTSLIVRFCCI